MGGITIPNINPRPDPWAQFAQAFFQGMQIREARERTQLAYESEAEDRKIRQQQLKLQMDQLKLESAEKDRQFARQSQGDRLDVFKLLSGAPGMQMPLPTPQQEVPGMATDLQGGMGPSTYEPMAPTRGTPMGVELPHPEIQLGPGVSARPPNLTQILQQSLMQARMKGMAEADAAGMRVQAEETARQPFRADERAATQAFDLKKLGIQEAGQNSRAQLSADATRDQQRMTREGKLLDDYARDTKDFGVVDDQINRIREFAKLQTGPGDIGLLYSYMKMLDPGSTVREGEYATAQNTGSIPARITAAYNKVLQGDRLSPEQRSQFVGAAETNYKALQGRRSGVQKKYEQTARRWGLDPNILGQSGGQSTGTPIIQRNTETGEFRHSLDGGKTWQPGRP